MKKTARTTINLGEDNHIELFKNYEQIRMFTNILF